MIKSDDVRLHSDKKRPSDLAGEAEEPEEVLDHDSFDPDVVFAAIAADQRIPFDDAVAMEELVFTLHIRVTDRRKIREE